ncbi:MAG: SsrA-binding protein SmpB [Fusobacterium sp.]|uniref:SsrA-binding protein SmpB n=1 Tax=Fusobacterium sp. TaxID=68766 RepID=UPI0026DBACA4|nr:SsrA-binding protein SmpB [Fusobacterium sp.]MDO4690358.1 SsrA-binding protein SmpB [Fusobacterium sp.]
MIIANNKKAFFDYFIEDRFEAGIELKGSEVKSVKAGKVSIKESFIRIINNEVFIMGMSIVPWQYGSVYNPEERRVRKLLLNKKEIRKLHEKVKIKGYTIVPLDVHLSKGYVKIQIAVAKGKKNYDKRESIAKKDQERNIRRELKVSKR